jgi:hypothetical protein
MKSEAREAEEKQVPHRRFAPIRMTKILGAQREVLLLRQ